MNPPYSCKFLSPKLQPALSLLIPPSVDQHTPMSGTTPGVCPNPADEVVLAKWYADHYPFTHIGGGNCYCIGDKVDEIIAWRNVDPDLQNPAVIVYPSPKCPI